MLYYMTMQIEVTTFSERTPLKVSFSLSRSVVIPAVVEEGLVTGYANAEVIELLRSVDFLNEGFKTLQNCLTKYLLRSNVLPSNYLSFLFTCNSNSNSPCLEQGPSIHLKYKQDLVGGILYLAKFGSSSDIISCIMVQLTVVGSSCTALNWSELGRVHLI